MIEFIEKPMTFRGKEILSGKSANQKAKEFIESVDDGNELIFRLH